MHTTSDLSFVAFLYSRGIQEEEMKESDRKAGIVVFTFLVDGVFQALQKEFKNRSARVEPAQFYQTIKEIRTRIKRCLKDKETEELVKDLNDPNYLSTGGTSEHEPTI